MISQNLLVETQSILPESDAVLYCETHIEGFKTVVENTGGFESSLDLETLFNTVIKNPGKVKEVFEKGGVHAR